MPDRERNPFLYLAVRYAECQTRPVRVPPAGCDCDEMDCAYSRVRESFELKVLWKLPASHVKAKQADDQWCQTVKQHATDLRREHVWPTPPCPSCESDPWVILATIRLPQSDKTDVTTADILETNRRVLLATQKIQVSVACIP